MRRIRLRGTAPCCDKHWGYVGLELSGSAMAKWEGCSRQIKWGGQVQAEDSGKEYGARFVIHSVFTARWWWCAGYQAAVGAGERDINPGVECASSW